MIATEDASPFAAAAVGDCAHAAEPVAKLQPCGSAAAGSVLAGFGLPRVAVVYANSKTAKGAVVHATQNTRFWKSYQAVAEDIRDALQELGLDAATMPDGADLIERLRDAGVELVWLNTGGVQGESPLSHAPAMLEAAGMPYVGHTPMNAALLDDKGQFKLACSGLGLATAPFVIYNPASGRFRTTSSSFMRAFGRDFVGPFVVKPVNGRASQNVEWVAHVEDLEGVVTAVAERTNNLVLVEKFLPGREFCIAVMGAGPAGALAFSPVERCLEEDEHIFTSMDTKAITKDRVRALDPETEGELVDRLFALGMAVYEALSLTSLVRLDIRADEAGRLFILEANPKPDLKRPSGDTTSIVCTGLPTLGWSYTDLICFALVERLWQLESFKPCMLEHFLPEGVTAEMLLQAAPARVAAVLEQPSVSSVLSLRLGSLLSVARTPSNRSAASFSGPPA